MDKTDQVSRNKMKFKTIIITLFFFQQSVYSASSSLFALTTQGGSLNSRDLQQQIEHYQNVFDHSRRSQSIDYNNPTSNMSELPPSVLSKSIFSNSGDCFGSVVPQQTPLNVVTDLEDDLKDRAYACRYDLYSFDTEKPSEKKINVDQYCRCVDKVAATSPEKFVIPDNSFEAFKSKSYNSIMANRVYDLFNLIESNAFSFNKYKEQYHINNGASPDFSCTESDIDKISEKIKGCFNTDIKNALDEKFELSFSAKGFRDGDGNLKDAKIRLTHIFDNATDRVNEFYGSDNRRVSDSSQIIDLVYNEFNKESHGVDKFSDEYLGRVKNFIESNELFRHEYYGHRQKAIAEADEDNRIRYYQTRGNEGTLNYKERIFSTKDENDFIISYLTTLNINFLKNVVNNFDDLEEVSNFLNDLDKSENLTVKRKANSIFWKTIHNSNKELVDECKDRIEALEYACDPANTDEVMEGITAVEFSKSNENFGGQDIFSAKYYCGSVGTAIDTKVASSYGKVYRSTADTSTIFNDIKTSYSNEIASFSESGTKNKSSLVDSSFTTNKQPITEEITDNTFDQSAEYLSKNLEQRENLPNQMDGQNLASSIVQNNSIKSSRDETYSDNKDEISDVIIDQDEKITSDSTDQLRDTENSLRKQISELQNQVAEFTKNVNNRKKSQRDKPSNTKKAASASNELENPFNRSSNNISRSSGAIIPSVSNIAPGPPATASSRSASSGSFSSSTSSGTASGTSSIVNNGGMKLVANSNNAQTIKLDDNVINSQDRKLVKEALQSGSNIVVLANGVTYFIEHDENGNVILSESSEELEAIAFSSFVGPRLPMQANEIKQVAGRSIASEVIEKTDEDSIYMKFLNAAEAIE